MTLGTAGCRQFPTVKPGNDRQRQGRAIFRDDMLGDEQSWTDTARLHEVVPRQIQPACSLGPGCAGSTHFGWNAGLGTRLYTWGVTSFLEARYHRTTRAGRGVHYVPVTFGLLF